nr:hypothetical protein [uncultured Lachnoclostridium sp.]
MFVITIDGTLELVSKSTESINTGDIIAIIVAIVSFVGIIITTILTNRTTKKINESNSKLQEKWNQKNIDASLIANARIEWIQKVRNTTAELVALYFEALNVVDKDILLDTVVKAQEKTELLILFFGHEEKGNNLVTIDMCSTEKNDNKNNQIVKFLSSLSKKLFRYYESVKTNELDKLKQIRENRLNEMHDHIVDYVYEEYTDEYGCPNTTQVPIMDEDYENSLDKIDSEIDNLVQVSTDINNDIIYLRDVIRTYLKIEWNKAKTGV